MKPTDQEAALFEALATRKENLEPAPLPAETLPSVAEAIVPPDRWWMDEAEVERRVNEKAAKGTEQVLKSFEGRAGVVPNTAEISRLARDKAKRDIDRMAAEQRETIRQRHAADIAARAGYSKDNILELGEINVLDYEARIQTILSNALAEDRGFKDFYQVPEGPNKKEIRKQASEQATREVNNAISVGFGAWAFIDPSPDASNRWIAEKAEAWLPDPLAVLRPAARETMATVWPTKTITKMPKGPDVVDYDSVDAIMGLLMGGTSAHTAAVNQFEEEGGWPLVNESIGKLAQGDIRGGIDSYRQAWKKGMAIKFGPGATEEQKLRRIASIRERETWTEYAMKQQGKLADFYDLSPMWRVKLQMGAPIFGFMVDVGEMEPVTPLIAGAGQVWRLAKTAQKTRAYDKIIAGFNKLASMPTATEAHAIALADKYSDGVGRATELYIASKGEIPSELVAQSQALRKKLVDLDGTLPALQKAIDDAVDVASRAKAAQARADIQVQIAETIYKQADLEHRIARGAVGRFNAAGGAALAKAEKTLAEAETVKVQAEAALKVSQAHAAKWASKFDALDQANRAALDANLALEAADTARKEALQAVAAPQKALREQREAIQAQIRDAMAAMKVAAKNADQPSVDALTKQIQGLEREVKRIGHELSAYSRIRGTAPLREAVRATSKAYGEARDAYKAAIEAAKPLVKDLKDPLFESERLVTAAWRLMVKHSRLEGDAASALSVMPEVMPLRAAIADLKTYKGLYKQKVDDAAAALQTAYQQLGVAHRASGKGTKVAARAVQDFVKQTKALMKITVEADLLDWQTNAWRYAVRELAVDMEKGLKALRALPPRARILADMLAPATVNTLRDGSRVIDPAILKTSLKATFGPGALTRAMADGGADFAPLWDLLKQAEPVTLTASAFGRIQQLRPRLEMFRELTVPDAAALGVVKAIETVAEDPHLRSSLFTSGDTVSVTANKIVDAFRVVLDNLDPIKSRIGTTSEEVRNVLATAVRVNDVARDEFQMVRRAGAGQAGLGGIVKKADEEGAIKLLLKYIDTTEQLDVYGRTTVFNTWVSPWTKARQQLLGDPRVESYAKLAAAATTDNLPPTHDMASKAMLALSRMWMPSARATAKQTSWLYGGARKLLADPKINTFEEFAEALRLITGSPQLPGKRGLGFATVETSTGRAIAIGADAVMHAAIQLDLNSMFTRAVGGLFTDSQAADMIRIATNEWHKVKDVRKALEGFGRMGASFTADVVRRQSIGREITAETMKLIKVGEDVGENGGAKAVYLMTPLVSAYDDMMDRVIKETSAQFLKQRSPLTNGFIRGVITTNLAWKTSVTAGLLWPRPAYLANQFFGDLSQVFFTEGLIKSVVVGGRTLPAYIPWVGKMMSRWAAKTSPDWQAGKPQLGPMMAAIVNADVHRALNGAPGALITKQGVAIPYTDMGRWMMEDGILETMVAEEFLVAWNRQQGNLSSGWRHLRNLQDDVYHFVNYTQQMQRAHLYADLVRAGATRKEARDRTLRAMYDWKNSLGQVEAAFATFVVPFVRFFHLAAKQWWRVAIAEPFTKAPMAKYGSAAGFARIKQLAILRDDVIPAEFDILRQHVPGWRASEQQERWLEDDKEYEAHLDALGLKDARFLRDRPWGERWSLGVIPNSEHAVWMFQNETSKKYPYSQMTMSPDTVLAMSKLMIGIPTFMIGAAAAMGDNPEWLAPNWNQTLFDAGFMMSGPVVEPIWAALAETYGADTPYEDGGGYNNISAGEARVIDLFSLGGMKWRYDPDTGRKQTTAGQAAFLRNLPLLLQFPPLLNAAYYQNPEWEHGPGAASRYFMRQYTGVGRATRFSRAMDLTRRQRRITEELTRTEDEVRGETSKPAVYRPERPK